MTKAATWRLVRDATQKLKAQDQPITPAAVARLAGISRTTLYNDDELREFIRRRSSPTTEASDGQWAWARGVLHIPLTEVLSKSLIKRKLAELSHHYQSDKTGNDDHQRVLEEAYRILQKEL
jgi:hypothetical protein